MKNLPNGTLSLLDENGKLRTMQSIEEDVLAFAVSHEKTTTAVAKALGIGRSTLYRKRGPCVKREPESVPAPSVLRERGRNPRINIFGKISKKIRQRMLDRRAERRAVRSRN